MPPLLALVLCVGLVGYLLTRDVLAHPRVSAALWIPTLWMVIIASRLPSEWLGEGAIVLQDARSYTDGSPFDRTVFLVLIIGGASVLLTRRVPWASLLARNWSICLFFLFTLISITWSDYPLTALKRWTKVAGHVTMVLVVLTADRPLESLSCLMRRAGFLLLPLSVLFIKYYPHLGRAFDFWTGAAVNLGVTTNKNALGAICLILGPFFLASVVAGRTSGSRHSIRQAQEDLICLAMAAWLLVMADSSAALGSAVVACSVILVLRLAPVRRYFFWLAGGSVALIVTLFATTPLLPTLIEYLGEDLTLTGRTELWADLLTIPVNPFLGAGFESFWIGDRIAWLWAKYWWQPNQAHNGFFETYLNLGIVGLGMQVLILGVALANARRDLLGHIALDDVPLATSQAAYKVAFVVGVTLFNLTDATFKAVHPLFFVFFLTAVHTADGHGRGLPRDRGVVQRRRARRPARASSPAALGAPASAVPLQA